MKTLDTVGREPVNSNHALCWSTQNVDGSSGFVTDAMNFDDDWNLHGNVFGDIRQEDQKMVAPGEISPVIINNMAVPESAVLPPQSITFLPDSPCPESPVTDIIPHHRDHSECPQ
jgi:hypothetical protein